MNEQVLREMMRNPRMCDGLGGLRRVSVGEWEGQVPGSRSHRVGAPCRDGRARRAWRRDIHLMRVARFPRRR